MTQPDLLDLYDRTLQHTSRVVANIAPELRTGPTPCSDWTVDNLLGHMAGTLLASVAFLDGTPPDVAAMAGQPLADEDHAGVFNAAAAASLAAHRAPGALAKEIDAPPGRMPAGMFLNFPLMDMWVHSWDLARATTQQPDFDEEITTYVLGFCRQAFGTNRPPAQVIGPEIDVDPSRPSIERLVGFLGRRPTWHA
ncbi:MAG: TIGR03086 family metal-binding protein [Acidimicrobiales bacterium]